MIFNVESQEKEMFELISQVAAELGFPAYVVGGYVRDRLLRRNSKDMDIVCIGDGIELANSIAARLKPRPRVNFFKRFGTAMFRYNNMEYEFVGARKESYRQDSRKPIVEDGSLEDDQNRRDFTINALAVSLNKENLGEIIDPFNGISHLESKILITPLEPGKTFADDPLRMMRAIRFATQLKFTIVPETLEGIKKHKNRIRIVSMERIATELNKILMSEQPSIGFNLLFDTGLLEIIFPEMVKLHGVEIRKGISHKDNFYHTIEVVDRISKNTKDLWLRWAAVLHDIAKPPTKRFSKTHGWTFYGHDAVGANMVPNIFRRFRLPMDQKMKFVQKMVRLHLRPISLTKDNISDSAIRRLLFDAGEDIDNLMILCEADITSKNKKKVKRYLENYELVRTRIVEIENSDHLRNWEPPISGKVIMETFGIDPCRQVGIIKKAIRDAILDGEIKNDYEIAFQFMIEEGKKIGLEKNS